MNRRWRPLKKHLFRSTIGKPQRCLVGSTPSVSHHLPESDRMIETDVVVIGSGAAGMTAAIKARALGMQVIVLEKTQVFGGTTALSGGALWVPCNPSMASFGVQDSPDDARTYLKAVLGEAYPDALAEAFISQAPQMLRFMEDRMRLAFTPYALPDYESELPGARRYRSLLTPAFDGRILGERLQELRLPLAQMMLFGSMQIDGADVRPLRNALRTWDGFRRSTRIVSRFVFERFRHGRGVRLTNGNALAARLLHCAIESGVALWRNAMAIEMAGNDQGRVGTVIVQKDGVRTRVHARRGVVLATGGFGANAAMRAECLPLAEHHLSLQPEGNVGDGIRLGIAAGGWQDRAHAGDCLWTPMSALHTGNGDVLAYPHTFLDRSMPGCIAVSPDGKRFVNEGTSYQTFVEAMHRLDLSKVYLVCNQAFLRRYGLGLAHPFPFSPSKLVAAGYLIASPTLEGLAPKIGVDAAALADTVRRFDADAGQGRDPAFGKGVDAHSNFRGDRDHLPNPGVGPLGPGPYFAVALHPGSLSTMGGLEVNGNAQVLKRDGQPVAGLYAVGADMNSVMRGHYPGGGSSIGPAMTFGYVAAMHLHQTR